MVLKLIFWLIEIFYEKLKEQLFKTPNALNAIDLHQGKMIDSYNKNSIFKV